MFKKKRWICGWILLFLVTGLLGCERQEETPKVEITLMHGWGGTLETHKIMQEIYARFSVENPDIILTRIPYSDSSIAVEKANDMLAVGKMPDIISTNGLSYFLSNAVKRGKALDLMPYIERSPELASAISPAVMEKWTTAGNHIYTVPDALELAGYWYNKQYFQEAGIVDEHGEAKLPSTWEGFLETARRLDVWAKENRPEVSVFALDPMQVIESFCLARIAGEGEAGMAMALHNPGKIDKLLLEPVRQDIEEMYQYSNNTANIENARQLFFDGKSMIYFNGVWDSDILEKSPVFQQIGYANYPLEQGKSLAYVSPSSGYVIGKSLDSRKNEACVRFLCYILSEEVQTKLALETGQAPSNPNFNQEELLSESPLLGMAVNTVNSADVKIETILSVWTAEQMDELEDYIYQNLER